jgi:hypothetical protein
MRNQAEGYQSQWFLLILVIHPNKPFLILLILFNTLSSKSQSIQSLPRTILF